MSVNIKTAQELEGTKVPNTSFPTINETPFGKITYLEFTFYRPNKT